MISIKVIPSLFQVIIMAKLKPRNILINECDKMVRQLALVQKASIVFDNVVGRESKTGDNTERLLKMFAKSMFEQAEYLSTLVQDVRDKI